MTKAADADAAFEAAAAHVSAGGLGSLTDDDRLSLYGLFSVAKKGPATGPTPSALNFRGAAKHAAWERVSELDPDDAKVRYVELVDRLSRRDTNKDGEKPHQPGIGRAAPSGFVIGGASMRAPDLSHWASVGDVKSIRFMLRTQTGGIDARDEEGLTALMRAADRNHVGVIDVLVEKGADVGVKDGDGMTALHYAALCDHAEAAGVLVMAGASLEAEDGDGSTPVEVAGEAAKGAMLSARRGEWVRPIVDRGEDVVGWKRAAVAVMSIAVVILAVAVAAFTGRARIGTKRPE